VVTKLPEHTVKNKCGGGEGVEIKLHSFLNSEPDGDEKTPLSPAGLPPKKELPITIT